MINVELLLDIPIGVYASAGGAGVGRIGEVVLLPNEIKGDEKPFEARPPWEIVVVAHEWRIESGIYTKHVPYDPQETFIVLRAEEWVYSQISALSNFESTLSLIQQNKNNGLQAAICHSCNLLGAKIAPNDKIGETTSIELTFKLNKCEMLYNK